jgi:hypothetical protein
MNLKLSQPLTAERANSYPLSLSPHQADTRAPSITPAETLNEAALRKYNKLADDLLNKDGSQSHSLYKDPIAADTLLYFTEFQNYEQLPPLLLHTLAIAPKQIFCAAFTQAATQYNFAGTCGQDHARYLSGVITQARCAMDSITELAGPAHPMHGYLTKEDNEQAEKMLRAFADYAAEQGYSYQAFARSNRQPSP